MVTLDAVFTGCIHQHLRSQDIRTQEDTRVFDRTVDMGLRREVYNDVRMFFPKQLEHRFPIRNIRLDKLHIWPVKDIF